MYYFPPPYDTHTIISKCTAHFANDSILKSRSASSSTQPLIVINLNSFGENKK